MIEGPTRFKGLPLQCTLAQRLMALKGKSTYTSLAALSGIAASTISAIARGIQTNPRIKTLMKLANHAFRITLETLMKPVAEDICYKACQIVFQSTTYTGGKHRRVTIEEY